MKKIVIIFICIFIFNTAYAAGYSVYDIEKETGIDFEFCCGSNNVTEYDYTKLSDEEKLNNALAYYFKLFEINPSMDDDSSPLCIIYFSGFQNYILESLESIIDKNIKNSKKYHYANIIYNISKNGLYEYDKIIEHIKQMGSISLKEINGFYKEKLNEEKCLLLESSYKAINFLKNNTDIKGDLQVAVFYEQILNENLTNEFMFDPDQRNGYNSQARKVDIFNSKTDIYSSTDVQGTGLYTELLTYLGEIDNNILVKFIDTFSKNNYSHNLYSNQTYRDILNFSTGCFIHEKIYIFPFMERVYVIKTYPLSYKLYDIFLFTLDRRSKYDYNDLVNNCDNNLFISNIKGRVKYNPRFSNINSLKAADLKKIPTEEVFKNTENSPFIKNKKALLSKQIDYDAYNKAKDYFYQSYTDYIGDYFSYHQVYIVPKEFYKFDIDNDKKDELLGVIEVSYSKLEDTARYTVILNEKTLELEDSELNKFLIEFMGRESSIVSKDYSSQFPNTKINNKLSENDIGKGIEHNIYQKIYTENGKNKIALIEDAAYGIYIDILAEKDKLQVNADTVYEYISNPKIVWKGKIENGRAEDLINTNASFDMSKASTLSEKAIVNDVNLRMLDRLSSDKYFKAVNSAGSEEKNRLLNERKQMNKKIKNCNGDNKCIKDILYVDVFK